MAKRPTLATLIDDLELVKQMAIDDRHITGAISAIVTQAKLLGLDKGVTDDDAPTAKQVIPNPKNIIRCVLRTIFGEI